MLRSSSTRAMVCFMGRLASPGGPWTGPGRAGSGCYVQEIMAECRSGTNERSSGERSQRPATTRPRPPWPTPAPCCAPPAPARWPPAPPASPSPPWSPPPRAGPVPADAAVRPVRAHAPPAGRPALRPDGRRPARRANPQTAPRLTVTGLAAPEPDPALKARWVARAPLCRVLCRLRGLPAVPAAPGGRAVHRRLRQRAPAAPGRPGIRRGRRRRRGRGGGRGDRALQRRPPGRAGRDCDGRRACAEAAGRAGGWSPATWTAATWRGRSTPCASPGRIP